MSEHARVGGSRRAAQRAAFPSGEARDDDRCDADPLGELPEWFTYEAERPPVTVNSIASIECKIITPLRFKIFWLGRDAIRQTARPFDLSAPDHAFETSPTRPVLLEEPAPQWHQYEFADPSASACTGPRAEAVNQAKIPVMTPNAKTPNAMLVTPIKVYFTSMVAARATMTLVMACSIDSRSKAWPWPACARWWRGVGGATVRPSRSRRYWGRPARPGPRLRGFFPRTIRVLRTPASAVRLRSRAP